MIFLPFIVWIGYAIPLAEMLDAFNFNSIWFVENLSMEMFNVFVNESLIQTTKTYVIEILENLLNATAISI